MAAPVQLKLRPYVLSNTTANTQSMTFTINGKADSQVVGIRVKYTATADAGTRQLAVQFMDGDSTVYAEHRPGVTTTAGLTTYVQFSPNAADMTAYRDTDWASCPIAPYILPIGHKIKVYAKSGSNAGDDMEVYVYLVW